MKCSRLNYNQVVNIARWAALLLVAAGFWGCGRNIQSKEAVRQGVIDHLASRSNLDLNLSGLQVDVTAVAFRENEADVTVAFRARGSGESSGMSMRYTMERKGSKWVVKSKAEAGGGSHTLGPGSEPGASKRGDLPACHPPLDQPPPAESKK